jgi:flagellar biosynthesis protein FlhG
MSFAAAASRVLVVVTPDPTSIADAYAVLKVLSQRYGVREFDILPNQVASATEAERIFEALLRLTTRFLTVRLNTPGYLCKDSMVERGLRSGEPFVTQSPKSASAQNMRALASHLLQQVPSSAKSMSGGLQLFWQRLSTNEHYGEQAQ